MGWIISTLYISYLSINDAERYGLASLMMIVVIIGIVFDLTDLDNYLPMTTIGPLPIAIPFVTYLMVTLVKGHDVGSLFIVPPTIYAFLYVVKLGFKK